MLPSMAGAGPVVAVVMTLAATACTSPERTAAPTMESSSTAPSTTPVAGAASARQDPSCRGLGEPTTGGAVTWVSEGRLFDESGCLLVLARPASVVTWGGKADRVVLGDTVIVRGQDPLPPVQGGRLSLSRPVGTSVLHVTGDGKLLKHQLATGQVRHIPVLRSHHAAVYHPAGRHIVAAGTDDGGSPALVIATNEGGDVRPLLGIESANAVADPSFTASGALLYTAAHSDRVDLHRLEIGDDKFSTVASVKRPGTIRDVTTSPFRGGGVAWTAGDCSSPSPPSLVAERGGKFLSIKGTEAEHARPVGWLPDGALVAVAGQMCNRSNTGKLLVVRTGGIEVIADRVTSAAARAVLPPPPPPPRSIPQQAPA